MKATNDSSVARAAGKAAAAKMREAMGMPQPQAKAKGKAKAAPKVKAKAAQVQAVLEAERLADAGWNWDPPSGGLYFWLIGPDGFDTSIGSDFCEACLANKVLYVPGDLCLAGGEPRNCVRLSYGVLSGAKLDEAVRRFVRTATAV